MFYLNKIGCIFFILSFFWQINVSAEDVKMYKDRTPSAEEMGKLLFPSKPDKKSAMKQGGLKMRSINIIKPSEPQQELSKQAAKTNQENSAVGLPIKFGYNSAEILEESKPFLNEVGIMLGMPEFIGEKMLIEGHTDASGSEKYNSYLSEKRADAVKMFLRNNFKIASDRLYVTGMGESQPLTGFNPCAAMNRRVQFRKAP